MIHFMLCRLHSQAQVTAAIIGNKELKCTGPPASYNCSWKRAYVPYVYVLRVTQNMCKRRVAHLNQRRSLKIADRFATGRQRGKRGLTRQFARRQASGTYKEITPVSLVTFI